MPSIYADFGQEAISKLAEEFNPDHLIRELKYCDQAEELVRLYRAAVLLRLQEIEKMSFVWTVELKKAHTYSGNKIEFQVTARNTPLTPNGDRHPIYGEGKRFAGNETRAEAIKYAMQLADAYRCPLIVSDGSTGKILTLTKKERATLEPYILRPRELNNYKVVAE